jgi:hypothetical protein
LARLLDTFPVMRREFGIKCKPRTQVVEMRFSLLRIPCLLRRSILAQEWIPFYHRQP